jgi:sterol desaturase/sphingolipid hydroxylase (fatty acid hydroxylase superfamily)
MNTIESRLAEQANLFIVLEVVSYIFLFLILIETVYDYTTGKRPNLKESFANAAIELGNRLLSFVLGIVFVVGLLLVEPLAVSNIAINPWSWVLAVIVADFSYYWMHRCEHRVRILWGLHNTHHSSPEFNLTTSFRLSWVESLVEWVFFVPMVLIGFDVVQVIGGLLIVVIYQTWIHTEKIGKLGWLDGVFNTPSAHRVHHGVNPEYIDKNYGGIFILWDRLFGTYQPETIRVTYGITVPLNSSNPFAIVFREFQNIARDLRRTRSWRNRLGYVFKQPGWSPTSSRPIS